MLERAVLVRDQELVRDEVRMTGRDRHCEELLLAIQSGASRCGVIGLGFIGSVLMNGLIEAGFEARGFDRSPAAVGRFARSRAAREGHAPTPCRCDADSDVIAGCDVIFVAVRNFVEDHRVNEEPLLAARDVIRRQRSHPCLVILESTVAPGTTRRFAQDLGLGRDDDIFVAHSPERLSAGEDHEALRAMPHLVAGIDAQSTRLAAAMIGRLCDRVVPVSSPEVSELSKLLENAFLSVNIGLTAEMTRIALGLGVRAQEVCRAAATKTRGFVAFHPGAGLGGHCLPNDLALLAHSARAQGWEPDLLAGAMAANEAAPGIVVARLERDLSAMDIPLQDAAVLIVGVGFKPGSPDTTQSPAIEIVRDLRRRNADVSYVDALNAGFAVDGTEVRSVAPEALSGRRFAAAVVVSGEQRLDPEALLAACSCVLDAGGFRLSRPAPGIRTL
jgi:UDP-N-acetyl-D-glucosamine dehydrogenase